MTPVGRRLLAASIVVSWVLFLALGSVYLAQRSELALAQMADSLTDALTGAGLLLALIVSRRPPDDDHHFGHRTAQPIAALVVAVLAGVLAVEVLRSAIASLQGDSVVLLEWPLVVVLSAKVLVKIVLLRVASRSERHASSAMRAFSIDARNDAILGTLSVVGFFAAREGWPQLDGWLAIPVALWIFGSGISLALESIQLLMGAAPSAERQHALRELVERVPDVSRVGNIRARHHGTELDIWAEVFVDASLSLSRAHDIGEAIEDLLLGEPDVEYAVVHVDADAKLPDQSSS